MKTAVVSQSDSLLKRSTVQEGRVDSCAVHACIKWTYLQTDLKKKVLWEFWGRYVRLWPGSQRGLKDKKVPQLAMSPGRNLSWATCGAAGGAM